MRHDPGFDSDIAFFWRKVPGPKAFADHRGGRGARGRVAWVGPRFCSEVKKGWLWHWVPRVFVLAVCVFTWA